MEMVRREETQGDRVAMEGLSGEGLLMWKAREEEGTPRCREQRDDFLSGRDLILGTERPMCMGPTSKGRML